jgi:enoyl-CoA hydratase
MTDELLVDLDANGIMTVTFNRPKSMNALNRATTEALLATIERAEAEARVLVLRGNDRAFSSGADLGAVNDAGADSAKQTGGILDVINVIVERLKNLAIPSVAGVSGAAAGVGCSLALACDYIVMSEKSYFMLAFTKIGLMPDGGATALVAASAGRHRAMRMALTAEKVQAATALDWGLASEVAAQDDWPARTAEVAATLAAGAPLAYRETRRAINEASLDGLTAALDREAEGQARLLSSADNKEGVAAFLEKRQATFTGN